MPKVALFEAGFDPYAELHAYAQQLVARHGLGRHGACASFVGSMRDSNEGDEVQSMFLEHYPGMTEKALATLCDQAMTDYPILDCLALHRIGEIRPGEPIVLVAAWSSHRGAAFDACRFLIETLKHEVPFWKKETLSAGSRWVENNTDG